MEGLGSMEWGFAGEPNDPWPINFKNGGLHQLSFSENQIKRSLSHRSSLDETHSLVEKSSDDSDKGIY